MNIREREFVLMSPGSTACRQDEVSFQDSEGESQPDPCVHGEGCMLQWSICVLEVSSLWKSPHLSEFRFRPCTKMGTQTILTVRGGYNGCAVNSESLYRCEELG